MEGRGKIRSILGVPTIWGGGDGTGLPLHCGGAATLLSNEAVYLWAELVANHPPGQPRHSPPSSLPSTSFPHSATPPPAKCLLLSAHCRSATREVRVVSSIILLLAELAAHT